MTPTHKIPLKTWKMETAERMGITMSNLESRLSDGRMDYPVVERINKRVINVLIYAESSQPKATAKQVTT